MKKSIAIIILISANFFASANDPKKSDLQLKTKVKGWVNDQPELLFEKNMGQFLSSDGKTANTVLYKGQYDGLDAYLTTSGLSYVYREFELDTLQKESNGIVSGRKENEEDEEIHKVIGERTYRVNLILEHTNQNTRIIEADRNAYFTNYYSSQHPEGITNVPHFGQIQYENVWEDINWRINSSGKGLKHEFVLKEGADLNLVKFKIEGAIQTEIKNGQLKIYTPYGTIEENELYCYVEKDGSLHEIKGNYKVERDGSIGFDISWDGKGTLVIDPNVLWSTYHKARRDGTGDEGCQMAVDKAGNLFCTGRTEASVGFPVLNGGGYFQGGVIGSDEIHILKFSPGGVKQWATFYGGSAIDRPHSVKPDDLGNVLITGHTSSANFPVSPGAYDNTFNGVSDAFVLSLSISGIRNWATYLGGSTTDIAYSIAADNMGVVYVTGNTASGNFPVINPGGAYVAGFSGSYDIFISKFTQTGTPVWSTYYGGSGYETGYAITVDVFRNIYLTGNTDGTLPTLTPGGATYFDNSFNGPTPYGSDIFILKFNSALVRQWSTYYGGNGMDDGYSVITDACGNLFVLGCTASSNIPTLDPGGGAYYDNSFNNGTPDGMLYETAALDLFILKFNSTGTLLWATYYGGNETDWNAVWDADNSLAIDSEGKIYITFCTSSGNLPVVNTSSAYTHGPLVLATECIYFVVFNNNGVPVWSSYIGSMTNGQDPDQPDNIGVDAQGNIVVMGGNYINGGLVLQNPGGGAYVKPYSGANRSAEMYFIRFSPINSLPFAGFTATPKSACASLTVNFVNSSTGYDTYTWNFGEGTPSTTYNASHVYNSPGIYPVTLILKKTSSCLNDTLRDTIRVLSCNINGIPKKLSVCAGSCPVLTASNGATAPYNYSWNTGATTQTINPCPAGNATYVVKITDALGATHTDTTFVSIAPAINVTIAASYPTCGGVNTGSAAANPTSGVSPFTYNWSSGQTSALVTGLGTGIFTVTVTDANGCTGTKTVNITTFPSFSLSATSTPSNCITTGTGTASVTGSGGTGAFMYSWLPPVSSTYNMNSNLGQLKSGTYTVVVTDGAGCTNSTTVNVAQTPPPVAGFSISPGKVICLGSSVTFTNTSGNPSVNWQLYNYTITPSFSTTGSGNTFSYTFNTPPGVGTFNIVQSGAVGGCAFNKTDTIAVVNCPPSGPAPAAFGGGCISSGDCTKKLYAGVTGGTAPYTYNWSTGATTSAIYPCPTTAAVYTLTVTDAGGFSATTTVAVSILPSSSFTPGPLATVCIGSTVNFVGATTAGATYSWTIYDAPAVSGTSANFSHAFLTAGRYAIFRSATNGSCGTQYRDTVNVINCSGPVVTATANAVCPSSCATATSSVTGGTAPYTYSWSNGGTTQNINPCPVTTTTYTVMIRDAGGTTATTTATVTVNPAVSVTVIPTNITCNGGTNGSATAAGNSGTAPYTYNWSGGVPGSGFQVSGLSAGTYTVTVTDNKGCSASSTTTILSPPALSGQFTKGTASCAGCGCKEWIMVTAAGGTSPYSYSWPASGGIVNRYRNQLCPGSYIINVKDKNGCSINVSLTTP